MCHMSLAKRNSEEMVKAYAVKRRGSQDKAPFQQQQQKHFGGTSSELRVVRPPRHAAATSHEANVAYMEDFRKSVGDLNLASQGSVGGRVNAKDRAYPNAALGGQTSGYYQPTDRRPVERRAYPGLGREGRRSKHTADLTFLADEYKGHGTGGGGAAVGWRTGPLDPGGQLVDLSDRNLLCASVLGDEAVFGCADHALYCVDLSRGAKTRQLYGSYSKSADAGHKEWVSTVSHTPHGDIVSGGLDGKLCLWPRDGGVPREVQAHAGSISAMKVDVEARVVTCGYGGALRVWDCRGGRRGGVVAPRKLCEVSDPSLPAPCMTFAWCGSQVLTGHRDGRLGLYDLETGQMVSGSSMKQQRAHRGHVTTAISAPSFCANREGGSACFVTGGQDGFIRVWDERVGKLGASEGDSGGLPPAAVLESAAHRGATGVGVVGEIITSEAGVGGTRLISYGADKRVCVLELRGGKGPASGDQNHRSSARASLAVEHVFSDHRDFIYCIDVLPSAAGDGRGGFLVTGGGDGLLLIHDLSSMRLLYGLRCCSAGAVRCAIVGRERLTVAGDDGNAMLYRYKYDG